MTRPTDEEIAAERNRQYAANDPEGCGFVDGARWALSQVQVLDWKRPEEELPEAGEDIVYVCDDHLVAGYFQAGQWFSRNPELDRVVRADYLHVTAWSRIPLPEWLESKE